MTLKEKLREQENVVFTAGKIVLLDGREIDCYPREKGCYQAYSLQEVLDILNTLPSSRI